MSDVENLGIANPIMDNLMVFEDEKGRIRVKR